MEQTLLQLGLNEKEARFYLFLLEEGSLTAAEIAKQLKENRTNTYMVLEKLISEKLVETNDITPVRQYRAADPVTLKARINQQMQQIKQAHAVLNTALPELSSLFNLGQHKPGVIYLEGLKGFQALLEDNAKLKQGTIDLIASEEAPSNKEAWAMLQKGIAKRQAREILTRGLFYVPPGEWPEIKKFESKGYEVRRWGEQELPGEIVIYGDKVAFTVYQPALVVTILTNGVIAQTFRTIFEQLWQQAKT